MVSISLTMRDQLSFSILYSLRSQQTAFSVGLAFKTSSELAIEAKAP